MGCGSSTAVGEDRPVKRESLATIPEESGGSPAPSTNTSFSGPAGEKKNGKDLSERLEGAAELAAAGAVAGAMASAAATAAINSDASLQNAPEELVRVTGEALLEMAKTVPFVAPVAYLIGAIASSAVTAITLKADCVEFGKIVQMLENILLKAENLENHVEVVDDVKESLEEGLILMQKMQDRGIIAATFLAKSDKSKFEDLRVRIEQAINRLNLSVTVDTAAITKAKFQQSEELRKKVEELGGPDVVEQDPEKAKMLEAHMEASDQILNANIVAARKSLKAVGEEVVKGNAVLKAVEQAQQDHMRETRKSILRTDSQLKEMTESFMKVQQQAELQRLQNEVLKRQVDELKSMLSDVKDCMTKFPMPPREPERLLIVNNGGFTQLSAEDVVQQKCKDVCMEAVKKWNTICMVNIIDDFTQISSCGFMPPSVANNLEGKASSGNASEPIEVAIDLCGIAIPRKAGMCQHVIAHEEPMLYLNTQGKSADDHLPPETTVDDLRQASKTDAKIKEFLARVEANENIFETRKDGIDERTMKILQTYMGELMNGGDFFYSGVPINVQGRSIGAFCLMGTRKPENFGDTDLEVQKAMCTRVEVALEQHLQMKQAQAQQAMVMGLQMMQVQQQGGGMMMGAGMMMPNMMGGMPNMNIMAQMQQQQQMQGMMNMAPKG